MRLLKKLASLRLTVWLLLWLTFLCVLGTVIQQHALSPMEGTPLAMRIIFLLSPADIFHSLWFLIPTAVLGLNAAACMYVWRKTFGGPSSIPVSGLCEMTVSGDADKISADLLAFVKAGYRTLHSREEGVEIIRCEKGAFRKFAPFLVHLSIILILLGVGMAFLGYKGSLEIPVGQATDVVTLGNGSTLQLPFQVRCDDFTMELYENGMPKEYRSEISFLRNNSVAQRSSVLVNHPVSFSRVLFSQSGYNRTLTADIRVTGPAGTNQVTVGEGSFMEIKDAGYKVHVVKVVEDVMGMGPGAQLIVEKPGGEEELWIFQRFEQIRAMHPGILEKMPHFNPSRINPYYFALGGVTGGYTTILGINFDPGIPLVGLGSVLFLIGICIAFMVVHEMVWISLEKTPRGLSVKVAQRSNGKPSAVSRQLQAHLDRLGGVRA
jgi:cytochrome c biogenesis protein